jgi:exoribonuclease II
MLSGHRWAKKMSTITDELKILIAICNLLQQVNEMHDFVGKDEVDSRLRWAAQNTANKINHLSNLNG